MAVKRKRKCKKKGCKAHPLKSGKFCFSHDPKRKKDYLKASARGGKTSMAPKTMANANYKLKSIPDVKTMLGDVTNDVLNGSIDINRAKAAMYGASILISCIKDYDLEKRMEKIEEILRDKGEN